ncbi:MFS transporter [Paenalcaligenes sp. Me131]|uniref:MFS transporter n=1 Tax=Paenalcaligenes sp. Me131 TaxID=3392636 RepID=UPI003D2C37E3
MSVYAQYKTLLNSPEVRAFVWAGLVARLALPMMGIGIITLVVQWRESYALAGAVSATFVLTYAVLSPQTSRWVDRKGQGYVLPRITALCVSGGGVLVAGTWWPLHDSVLFVGAALLGFMPSVSALIRARWTARLVGQPSLQTAYSLETVVDELSFIVGPPLSVGLSVLAFAQAGVLLALLMLTVGAMALMRQKATEPTVVAADIAAGHSVLFSAPTVPLLTLLMVAMGVMVGAVDILSVAFAEQQGQPAAASVVLSAYAVGSCVAGLVFGARSFTTPLPTLLAWGGIAIAASTLPFLWVNSVLGLSVAVLIAGVCFAPTMIVAMSLVERSLAASHITEGMTWLLAGLNSGVALGASWSGRLVDDAGASAGMAVLWWAGAAVLMMAVIGTVQLRKQPRLPSSAC